jgi:hypothetical protein
MPPGARGGPHADRRRLTTASEPCAVPLPAIVKPAWEDGSAGIWARSVVADTTSLRERVAEVLGLFKGPCLVEQYIDGREFNVALLGFPEARILPLQEIDFSALPADHPRIVSYRAKWAPARPRTSAPGPSCTPSSRRSSPPASAARRRRPGAWWAGVTTAGSTSVSTRPAHRTWSTSTPTAISPPTPASPAPPAPSASTTRRSCGARGLRAAAAERARQPRPPRPVRSDEAR